MKLAASEVIPAVVGRFYFGSDIFETRLFWAFFTLVLAGVGDAELFLLVHLLLRFSSILRWREAAVFSKYRSEPIRFIAGFYIKEVSFDFYREILTENWDIFRDMGVSAGTETRWLAKLVY